jgi:prepilin-type N-terminal cleavage/methylation domain-containing protein
MTDNFGRDRRRFVRHPRHRREGFTLTELMMVVVLVSIIGLMLTMVLVRQSRFHRAVQDVSESRNRMRDIATIVPTDLRGVSTSQNDILAFGYDSLQFRAFIGTSIVCEFVSTTVVGLPPKILTSGDVLSAWINAPAPGDLAYIYDDGTKVGNFDDSWTRFTISDTTSATTSTWCASTLSPAYTVAGDNAARRYRITLATAANTATIKRGAVIRFAREVRYSGYQAADNQWYMGYQTCTPNAGTSTAGTCGTREVLAGPIMPITGDTNTTGLFFKYFDKAGAEVTTAANITKIARISINVRTASASIRQAVSTRISSFTGGDSLRFTVAIRNRI